MSSIRALAPVDAPAGRRDESSVRVHVHLVAHNSQLGAIGVCPDDLASGGAQGVLRRVVELRDPSPGEHVADLCTSERELPEVVSAILAAEQVHLHGLSPRIGLHMLPYVKPELLRGTVLVVHGPWPRVTASVDADATRIGAWPGPVVFDELARRSHEEDLAADVPVDAATADRAEPAADVASRLHVDVHQPALLPREEGPTPHQPRAEGRPLVVVTFAAEFGAAAREALLAALATAKLEGLEVELWDEAGLPAGQRASLRRHAQACVAPVRFYWSSSRTALEAMAQAVPLLSFGESLEPPPPGVQHFTQPTALVGELERWADDWRQGRPAPVDVQSGRDWLLSRAA